MQLETLFTEMADALRTKEDTTNKISAESFPQRIKDLKVLDTTDATATANDIVAGKIAYANGKRIIGTVIDNGKLEYTPSEEEQIIPAGKTSGGVVKAIDSDEVVIVPTTEEQVKEGLFNKVTVGAIESEELTITPSKEEQIREGVFSKVVVEAMNTENLIVTPTNKEQNFNGLFENVTVEATSGGIDTSDATATAEDIVKDKTAYVNGEKIVGTLSLSAGSRNATIIGGAGFNARKCIKEVDLTGVTLSVTTTGVFQDCTNLETIKGLDLSTSSTLYNGFSSCSKLKNLDINNTQNITNWQYAFKSAVVIQDLKQLRGDKANNMGSCFQSCSNLTNFGGFLNLGKGYTGTTENNSSYKLDLSPCTKLTHESLMNVINGLYDLNLTYKVADGGTLKTQTLNLGSTNLAKLTTADEIAIATAKRLDSILKGGILNDFI